MPRLVRAEPVRFAPSSTIYPELRRRIAEQFRGRSPRGNAAMVMKSAILLVWVGAGWATLVFVPLPGWLALLGCVGLGVACGGLGLNIPHDANHAAYGRRPWVNAVMARVADVLLGASSYMWRVRHNVMHHHTPNIEGHDETISYRGVIRIKPAQPWRPKHRYQAIYVWPLYSIVLLKWFLWDDFKWFASGRMDSYDLEMGRRAKVELVAYKAIWLGYMVVLPAFFHPLGQVLLAFTLTYLVFSLTLVGITQLAHVNGLVSFPEADPGIGDEWIVHQLATTVDFGHSNRLLNWYAGGLNFQIVHHLFPAMCHVHYPELAPIVRRELEARGLRYLYFPTLRAAVRGHCEFLARLGSAP